MNPTLLTALILTACIGATLIALRTFLTQAEPTDCTYCRCPWDSHLKRFGPSGRCLRCRTCAEYDDKAR